MSKMPAIGGKDLVRAPRMLGFVLARIHGSHSFLQHADGRSTVVPVHGNETVGPGLLSRILRECEITREVLLSVL
jgi:predicted RNA binding protein YcfA (HicA-like mRNA interferase family)